jgi:hypothetical protein
MAAIKLNGGNAINGLPAECIPLPFVADLTMIT